MTKVLVVGGGIAGVSAANAARRYGAKVCVLEASNQIGLNKSLFPYLLSGEPAPRELNVRGAQELAALGVEVRLGEKITKVEPGIAVTDRGVHSFDRLVIATGSIHVTEGVRGVSKKGVFVMRGLEDYRELSRHAATSGPTRFALAGAAPLALHAADILSRKLKVIAYLGGTHLSRFSEAIQRRISHAAISRGVELVTGHIDAIVGMRGVEAAVSDGVVRPCDAVAIFPRSLPNLPLVGCLRGDGGGVIVDRSMRTSSRGIFAAGDCAELRMGSSSIPFRLHSSARVMGEVAGRNAAAAAVGGCGIASAGVSGALGLQVFGLEVCTAGIDRVEARKVGLEVVEAEAEGADDGAGALCSSLVFDRATHEIYGIQLAGPGALSHSDYASMLTCSHVTLEQVAYQDSAYLPHLDRDVSPIRLTAGKGLAGL